MPIAYRTSGQPIYADDYNRLQEKVASILGAGGGIYGTDYGYGQTLQSSQVIEPTVGVPNTGDLVTKEQMNQLRTDIMKVWYHQTSDEFPLNTVTVTDTVTAGGTNTVLSEEVSKTYNDYTFVVNSIDTNRRIAAPTAMTLQSDIAVYQVSNWNNFKTHDVTVTFLDSNHRRYFFNAGGEIRIAASLNGSWNVNTKSYVWQQLLGQAGVYICGYNINTQLTSAPQQLFYTSPTSSAVYSENYYKIVGSSLSSNTIFFRIVFHDVDVGDQQNAGAQPGPAEDENVNGTTSSTISLYYPTGVVVDPELGTTMDGVKINKPTITSIQGTVY